MGRLIFFSGRQVDFFFYILLYYFNNAMIKTLYISSFIVVYIIYKKNINAACHALLQGFVNGKQLSILFYLWNCRRYIFCRTLKKPIFSMQIIFFTFYRKKSRNKLCLEPHDTNVLFRTFFSQVNNKWFFFEQINSIESAIGEKTITSCK